MSVINRRWLDLVKIEAERDAWRMWEDFEIMSDGDEEGEEWPQPEQGLIPSSTEIPGSPLQPSMEYLPETSPDTTGMLPGLPPEQL